MKSTKKAPSENTLPIPDFYQAAHAADFTYQADPDSLLATAVEWGAQHRVAAAGSDKTKTHLLLIDLQKDFCFTEGSLYVGGRSGTGAIDDNDRIARFIYQNVAEITEITCTLDTHFPFQIFFPAFWLGPDDQAPSAHAMITTKEISAGTYRPNPKVAWWLCNGNYSWLQKQVAFYCEQLETAGKYLLYLWPPHCLLGSVGHGLAGVIDEARLFHAFLRGARGGMEIKGGNSLTENYSVLAPEVLQRHDGKPLGQRNTQFIKTLLDSDRVIIAGQAASHCVKSTIDDLLSEIQATDPKLAEKVYILADCMSAVAVPDPDAAGEFLFDFTDEAEAALQQFANAGMNIIHSDQALAEL